MNQKVFNNLRDVPLAEQKEERKRRIMDKRMVALLSDCGWSQSKIARRLGVDRSLVCRFLNLIKRSEDCFKEIKCEFCNNSLKKKNQCSVKIEGVNPFIVCNKCRKRFEEDY